MALITVRPTKLDRWVAKAVTKHTNVGTERAAQVVTWGADEHVLCLLAAGWWLYCRNSNADLRRASTHVLATTIASSLLPHLLKRVFDQERPDRKTLFGHFRGIPFSGKTYDAFPSGHAVHMGALASAATELPRRQRNAVWGLSAGLVLTRVVLLAHWVSDVAAGLVVGAGLEQALRFVTGYGSAKNDGRQANNYGSPRAGAVNTKEAAYEAAPEGEVGRGTVYDNP
jgi:membrane-associated phospholipid phosphatase